MNKIICINKKWYLGKEIKGEIVFAPLDENRAYLVKDKIENVRTAKQNASLHKYFSQVSNTLNDGGLSLQRVVSNFKKADIEWTLESVKEIIWRNIQFALLDKKSTTALTTHELMKVYKNVDFYLSKNIGIDSIAFPSVESMLFEKNYKDKI